MFPVRSGGSYRTSRCFALSPSPHSEHSLCPSQGVRWSPQSSAHPAWTHAACLSEVIPHSAHPAAGCLGSDSLAMVTARKTIFFSPYALLFYFLSFLNYVFKFLI